MLFEGDAKHTVNATVYWALALEAIVSVLRTSSDYKQEEYPHRYQIGPQAIKMQ